MELKQLKYFTQVADSESFSRAAELLHISQPSLSQQIKNLEEELEVDLLVRHPRGVALTELGKEFYGRAHRILQEAENAKDAMWEKSVNPSGKLLVGIPTSACRGLSHPLFRTLSDRYPNIKLHIVEAMTSYLDDLIQAGRLDVALLYNHKAYEHVAWTEMMVEQFMLFVRPDNPIHTVESISFRELFDLPIVLPGRPNVMNIVMEQLAIRHGIHYKALDCDSLPAIAKMICESDYMSVMPHFAFSEEVDQGTMTAIPIVDPTPSWRLSVVVSKRTLNIRGSQAVAETMADVIAGMVEAGTWRAQLSSAVNQKNAVRFTDS